MPHRTGVQCVCRDADRRDLAGYGAYLHWHPSVVEKPCRGFGTQLWSVPDASAQRENRALTRKPFACMMVMMRRRATVDVSVRVPKARRGGQQPRLWAYGYADLAVLFREEESVLRRRVAAGKLDPVDLESVCAEWAERRKG